MCYVQKRPAKRRSKCPVKLIRKAVYERLQSVNYGPHFVGI